MIQNERIPNLDLAVSKVVTLALAKNSLENRI